MLRHVVTDVLLRSSVTLMQHSVGVPGSSLGLTSLQAFSATLAKRLNGHLYTTNCGRVPKNNLASRAYNVPVSISDSDEEELSVPCPLDIPEVYGNIHSMESFSAVDGPGVRFLVFLQGCSFRCVFCSNPDTWQPNAGIKVSSKDIARKLERVLPYLQAATKGKSFHALHGDGKHHLGGITLSGGEPLLQPAFAKALFEEAHARGLTTCLDTTGQGSKHSCWDVVLPHTDYALVCIKAMDPWKYMYITKRKQDGVLRFINELEERQTPYWLRYVLLPKVTDTDKDVEQLLKYIETKRSLQAVEVLPYHLLGVQKWEELGLQYPLGEHPAATHEEVESFLDKLRVQGVPVLCSS